MTSTGPNLYSGLQKPVTIADFSIHEIRLWKNKYQTNSKLWEGFFFEKRKMKMFQCDWIFLWKSSKNLKTKLEKKSKKNHLLKNLFWILLKFSHLKWAIPRRLYLFIVSLSVNSVFLSSFPSLPRHNLYHNMIHRLCRHPLFAFSHKIENGMKSNSKLLFNTVTMITFPTIQLNKYYMARTKKNDVRL